MRNLIFIFNFLFVISCTTQTNKNSATENKESENIEIQDDKTESIESTESNVSTEIDVTLNFKHFIENNQIYFEITTNLPDNFIGKMTVRDSQDKIVGQSDFTVINGIIKSEKFSNKDKALSSGEYVLTMTSPYPHLQKDESVKNIIGKSGENLIGKYIERRKDNIFNEDFSFLKANYKFSIATNNKSDANTGTVGIWILDKGNDNKTEYRIYKKSDKLFLSTKVFSKNMSPFTTESELIKIDGKYIRIDEKENPIYKFEIKNDELIIYDSYGVYSTLKNTN